MLLSNHIPFYKTVIRLIVSGLQCLDGGLACFCFIDSL